MTLVAFFTRGGGPRPTEQLGAEGAGQSLRGLPLAEASWGEEEGLWEAVADTLLV